MKTFCLRLIVCGIGVWLAVPAGAQTTTLTVHHNANLRADRSPQSAPLKTTSNPTTALASDIDSTWDKPAPVGQTGLIGPIDNHHVIVTTNKR